MRILTFNRVESRIFKGSFILFCREIKTKKQNTRNVRLLRSFAWQSRETEIWSEAVVKWGWRLMKPTAKMRLSQKVRDLKNQEVKEEPRGESQGPLVQTGQSVGQPLTRAILFFCLWTCNKGACVLHAAAA